METKRNKKRSATNGKAHLSANTRTYDGFSLESVVYRKGALEILNAPSRYNTKLIYPPQYNKDKMNGEV